MIATTDFEILPELKTALPPSTPDERKRLKEGIERDGMLYGILLCTIKGMPGRYILDGHTRYEIALELDMPPVIHADDTLPFDSIDNAVCWIIEHQAARRNLTEQQQRMIAGRLYELRKKAHGTNRYTNEKSDQIDHSKTSERIARDLGISAPTVRRAAAETKKIDALGLTSAVMNGTVKKIESAALDELEEAVEQEPERKEELVEEFIDRAKQNNGRAKSPHVTNNSGDNEWYTPPEFVEAARKVMGSITLDPATSHEANEIVQAYTVFTAEDNGLERDWSGNVWMNPPYSSDLIGKFIEKLVVSIEEGGVQSAVVLVNNATETKWFARLASVSSMLCFPTGRIKFWHPRKESTPLQGQAIAYVGGDRERFREQFRVFGIVAEVA